ncbi:MAG: hypothetical protein ACRC1K_15655 [Planctomycetia bacterium]
MTIPSGDDSSLLEPGILPDNVNSDTVNQKECIFEFIESAAGYPPRPILGEGLNLIDHVFLIRSKTMTSFYRFARKFLTEPARELRLAAMVRLDLELRIKDNLRMRILIDWLQKFIHGHAPHLRRCRASSTYLISTI